MAKKIDCTLQREQADRQREQRSDSARRGGKPSASAPQPGAEPIKREPDAIGADAEEHHMRERDDTGIAEQHVVGCDERRHDADFCSDVEGWRRETGTAPREHEDDQDTRSRSAQSARRIAGEKPHRPLTG